MRGARTPQESARWIDRAVYPERPMVHVRKKLLRSVAGVVLLAACKTSSTSVELPTTSSKDASTMLPSVTVPSAVTGTAPSRTESTALTVGPLTPEDRARDADGERAFGAKLYAELAKGQSGNLFVSPASARFALAMLLGGARGETARELSTVLGATDKTHDVAAALANEWAALAVPARPDDFYKNQSIVLRTANRLFAQRGKSFEPAFVSLTGSRYGAPIEGVDFVGDGEGARRTINDWVAARTEQRIKDILPPPVPKDTRLVLANAIYFKAAWDHPFSASETKRAPFFAPSGTLDVPTMRTTSQYRYGETSDAQIVELPYGAFGRNDVTMLLVVPKAKDGLGALERSLDGARIATWASTPSGLTEVDLSLPKLKIESTLSLAPTLGAMGAPSLFAAGKADLSGVDGTRELFVGLVIQKTFVAVDEKGTEAAAATVVAMRAGGPPHAPPKPVVMRADRPFLFFIRDAARGRLLFMGRLVAPATS